MVPIFSLINNSNMCRIVPYSCPPCYTVSKYLYQNVWQSTRIQESVKVMVFGAHLPFLALTVSKWFYSPLSLLSMAVYELQWTAHMHTCTPKQTHKPLINPPHTSSQGVFVLGAGGVNYLHSSIGNIFPPSPTASYWISKLQTGLHTYHMVFWCVGFDLKTLSIK